MNGEDVQRIIVTKARGNGRGSALKWDARLESTGDLIAFGVERPLAVGAAAMLDAGWPPSTLVTMRHKALGYDSFRPMPLECAARRARARAGGGTPGP